jgi:hypothetical protein
MRPGLALVHAHEAHGVEVACDVDRLEEARRAIRLYAERSGDRLVQGVAFSAGRGRSCVGNLAQN